MNIQKKNRILIKLLFDLIDALFLSAYRYIWAGLLVVLGIYLNVLSKRNKLTTQELLVKIGNSLKLPNKFHMVFERHQKDAMFEV